MDQPEPLGSQLCTLFTKRPDREGLGKPAFEAALYRLSKRRRDQEGKLRAAVGGSQAAGARMIFIPFPSYFAPPLHPLVVHTPIPPRVRNARTRAWGRGDALHPRGRREKKQRAKHEPPHDRR